MNGLAVFQIWLAMLLASAIVWIALVKAIWGMIS